MKQEADLVLFCSSVDSSGFKLGVCFENGVYLYTYTLDGAATEYYEKDEVERFMILHHIIEF